MTKRKVVSLIPADGNWTATFSESGTPAVYVVACWALMEAANGVQEVVPLVAIGRSVVPADDIEDKTFIGLSRG